MTVTKTMTDAELTAAILRCAGNGHPAMQKGRLRRLRRILAEHPRVDLVACADENTGRRYGRAECRKGRCAKIGHTTYAYQIWAVWE